MLYHSLCSLSSFLLLLEAEKIMKALSVIPYLLHLLTVEEAYLLSAPIKCPSPTHPNILNSYSGKTETQRNTEVVS